MNFEIINYNENFKNEWEQFVNESINGTIYHTRKFLSYHENKFEDSSILIYNDKKLVCILPCCKDNSKYFSHKGATFGGPIFIEEVYNVTDVNTIINLIIKHYNNNIEFRLSNNIYNNLSHDLIIYCLSNKLKLKPELGFFINSNDNLIEKITNIRNKKNLIKFMNNKNIICDIYKEKNDYINFYNILNNNLSNKYKTNPTHTLEEFLLMSEILKNEHSLYLVKENDVIYGGVYLIKTSNRCWYTFYISKNIDIKKNPSIIYIMYKIQQDAKEQNVKYIDYGITTEEKGKVLNIGLAEFKEFSLSGNPTLRYLFLLN